MKSQRSSILIAIFAGLLAFVPVAQAKKDKGGYLAYPAATKWLPKLFGHSFLEYRANLSR